MKTKKNPLKLNPLQSKTLVLLQALANNSDYSEKDEQGGDIRILSFPQAHGSHFHIGDLVLMAKDASGLNNQSVWRALERKCLINCEYPIRISLTINGQQYDSGVADQILHHSNH